jgi:hypothetical protein
MLFTDPLRVHRAVVWPLPAASVGLGDALGVIDGSDVGAASDVAPLLPLHPAMAPAIATARAAASRLMVDADSPADRSGMGVT